MKLNIQKITRHILPVLSAFFVVMACIAFPASAAAVSYQDFDPEIVVDGDNNLITIDIPVDYYKLGLRDGNLNTLGSWVGVDSFSYYATAGTEYSILFTLFQNGTPFSLIDIPDGTVFNVDFSVSSVATISNDVSGFQTEYWWYDASDATVSWEYHNETPKGYDGTYSFSFPVSKKDGVTSFSFGGTYYANPCISSNDLRFTLDSVTMQFSISNFYLLQQSNQQTQAMLDEVNRQLAEQGKTMQDILDQQAQTNDKLDFIQNSQQQTNNKLDSIQSSQQQTNNKLDSIQSDQQQTNNKLDSIQGSQNQTNEKLDDVISGTPAQNESANNAAGILGDKGAQLGSLAGSIQPDKPNLDSVSTNVGDLVPSSGLNTLTSAISPIANNELVIKVLVMVATLILVSYVLFGKRG